MPKLGINIDHVATLRQARGELEPDPILAAQICEEAGADSIVAHLREDRRHINDRDILRLRKTVKTRFNLEMSLNNEIVNIALRIRPDQATLVPEKRKEITTEGGLDIIKYFDRIKRTVRLLEYRGIVVSLFIDPVIEQIQKTKESGAKVIELHTGNYARAKTRTHIQKELYRLIACTKFAQHLGLIVNAGHGLNYHNARAIAKIPTIEELNIGHSIISRAVFIGLKQAVKEMIHLIR